MRESRKHQSFEFLLIFMFNVPEAEFHNPVDWHSRIVLKAIKKKKRNIYQEGTLSVYYYAVSACEL